MLRRELQNDFQILSIDLPDHGKSVFTDKFSYQHYANLIIGLLDRLNISKVSLVGHSMGGKVAMTIALNHQTRIGSLVIIDIAPVKYKPRHTNIFKGLTSVDLAKLADRKQADIILSGFIPELGVRQFLLKSLYQSDEGWKWRFNLTLLQRDYDRLSMEITENHSYDKPSLFIKACKCGVNCPL